MASVDELVVRGIELKQELVTFLRDRRIAHEYAEALDEEFGDDDPDDDDLVDFRDEFLLSHRMSDDRTPVERFVRARGDLPRAERDLLLSWVDPWDSVFEVGEVEGDVVYALNLVDELPCRIRTPEGGLAELDTGALVGLRLVPVGEDWLLMGSVLTVPEDDLLLKSAAAEALAHDESACRNPGHRERALAIHRQEREAFSAHFGGPFVVVHGWEVPERLAAWWAAMGREWDVEPEAWPDELLATTWVGLGFDETDGLTLHEDFGDLVAAFEPDGMSEDGLELVDLHVRSPLLSPMPLLRCIETHPDTRDAVLAAALGRRSFSWERDGAALLAEHKPDYVTGSPRPTTSIVPDRLQPFLEAPSAGWIDRARGIG